MTDNFKTNEEMLEEWDWRKAQPIGRAVPRSTAHKEGIPHEGVHLWIIRNQKGYPEILFQQRAKHKDTYPDCLDITVGGHVPFGVNDNKIQKESIEEIGISPSYKELADLGYFRYEDRSESMFHREFQHVYLLLDNRPIDEYSFNDGEVVAITSVPLDDLELLLKKEFSFLASEYDGERINKKHLSRKDFHPLLFVNIMSEYMRVVIEGAKEIARRN